MNVSASIPATVEIRRNRLLGLLVAVAAVAATITYVVFAFAFDGGASTAAPSVRTACVCSGLVRGAGRAQSPVAHVDDTCAARGKRHSAPDTPCRALRAARRWRRCWPR